MWVRPIGELDIASASRFDAAVDAGQAESHVTIIDLRGVEFIDSSGLARLLAADSRGRSAGKRVIFFRGTPRIQRLLGLTGIDARLRIVDGSELKSDAE